MMADSSYISPEEYFKLEEASLIKHEYINGKIYAMAGADDAHVTISGNLFSLLRNHLRNTGCRVYMSDMKVQIETRNIYYYPDIIVTCDARDQTSLNCKHYPCLIVEVLSRSTEGFDRGDKFADYRRIETLQEYVLISKTRPNIEIFRRNETGNWVLYNDMADVSLPLSAAANFRLETVNFTGTIAALYEDVDFS